MPRRAIGTCQEEQLEHAKKSNWNMPRRAIGTCQEEQLEHAKKSNWNMPRRAMGFAVRVRSAGQKYGPTCHQRDRADVTEFVTLVRLSSLGQHVDVLALAGYKRRKSALTAGPIGESFLSSLSPFTTTRPLVSNGDLCSKNREPGVINCCPRGRVRGVVPYLVSVESDFDPSLQYKCKFRLGNPSGGSHDLGARPLQERSIIRQYFLLSRPELHGSRGRYNYAWMGESWCSGRGNPGSSQHSRRRGAAKGLNYILRVNF